MRKLALLSVFMLFGGFAIGDAWAGACKWDFGHFESPANEYIYKTDGYKERVVCDSSKCGHGTFFFAPAGHVFEGLRKTEAILYKCAVESDGDLWIPMNKEDFTLCPGYTKTNCTKWHYLDKKSGTTTKISGSGGVVQVNNQSDLCYYCDGDVATNPKCTKIDGTFAVTGDTVDAYCKGSKLTTIASGLSSVDNLSGKICSAKCTANGWDITLKTDSCATDYEPDTATNKKCVLTAVAKQKQQNQQQEQQNRDNKTKCETSGGTWSGSNCTCDAAKNLKPENGACVCLDDVNYKRSADGKSCDLTDVAALQRACTSAAASGAEWDAEHNRCKCTDLDKTWNGTACVENTQIKQCKSASGTKWDYDSEQCVCTDSNYEYDEASNKCVETDAARQNRETAKKQSESQARITSIVGKINNLKSGLDTSVWKDKEGNFNTSRLVSDSVAGVVLGTAGGLITSKVMKKNQIKGGFEDLNCTIRGQVVAGYGDEFQVGIQ